MFSAFFSFACLHASFSSSSYVGYHQDLSKCCFLSAFFSWCTHTYSEKSYEFICTAYEGTLNHKVGRKWFLTKLRTRDLFASCHGFLQNSGSESVSDPKTQSGINNKFFNSMSFFCTTVFFFTNGVELKNVHFLVKCSAFCMRLNAMPSQATASPSRHLPPLARLRSNSYAEIAKRRISTICSSTAAAYQENFLP